MKTSVHQHGVLEYSVGDIEPMEFTCSSRDKPLSNFRVLLTTRAAEFFRLQSSFTL